MEFTPDTLPTQYDSRLLQWVLPLLGQQWIEGLRKVLQIIRRQLSRQVHEGVYEVLEYEAVLQIADRQGRKAVFERRQKVRFLQDNVLAFEDQAWGEGEIFADYECSPGVAVDRYRDGLKWRVLISLREAKQRGEVIDFRSRRTIVNGFSEVEEWWQTEVTFKTHHLRVSVVFPQDRLCQEALLVERNRHRTTRLDSSHFGRLPDGRQVVAWERRHPPINEVYTLKWRW